MTDQEIVNAYAGGMTCSKQHSMFMRGDKFSIIYHKSHAAYTDRFSRTQSCSSYWAIVRNGVKKYGGHFGKKETAEVITGGRMNKVKRAMLEECLKLSNQFDKIILPEAVTITDNVGEELSPQTIEVKYKYDSFDDDVLL